jgi:hypothetical protein
MTLKLRREDVSPDHFQVYSGEVRIGTIYRTHQHPGGNEWMWFLNGVQNAPVRVNGFAVTFDDAKAEFARLLARVAQGRRLTEDTPTAQLRSRMTASRIEHRGARRSRGFVPK